MRGLIAKKKVASREITGEEISKGPHPEYVSLLDTPPMQFPHPLALKSEFQGNSIVIDTDEIASEIVANHDYLLKFTMKSAGNVLILAYETTIQHHDHGPLWEFLRHCRNAAAHDGLFHFKKGEPRYSAEWGKFQIEATMQGDPLFGNKNTHGLLGPGDPIRLLWDIEQAYPALSA